MKIKSLKKRMMRKWMSITAAAVLSLTAANAHAIPTLQLTDFNTTVTVEDNQAGDSNPLAGAVTFMGSIGTWFLNVSTGISDPLSPQIDLSSVNSSSGAGDLLVAFTDTGFTGSSTFQTNVGGVTSGTAGFLSFLGDFNDPFGTDTLLAALGPFGPGAFSGTQVTQVSPSSPYSLTLTGLFHHDEAGSTMFSMGTQPVPEPSTLLLLGSGLLGLAGFGRRRKV